MQPGNPLLCVAVLQEFMLEVVVEVGVVVVEVVVVAVPLDVVVVELDGLPPVVR